MWNVLNSSKHTELITSKGNPSYVIPARLGFTVINLSTVVRGELGDRSAGQ